MTAFLAHPGRPGSFGALLDESARAAEDLCRLVESVPPDRFVARRASEDPNCVSILEICRHVASAARRYADYVRKARGMDFVDRFELDPALLVRPADLRPRLVEALRYTEDAVAGLDGLTDEGLRALEFTVRWGPRYDPEMILEHGVCHLLRHRRQIERW